MKVGLVGLGVMGSAMASHLLEAGYDLSVYSRNRAHVASRAPRGSFVSDSPSALGRNVSVLFTCVTDGAAVIDVLFGPSGAAQSLHAGSLVIDCSTIAPSEAKEIAARLKKDAIDFLDAPVTGGDVGARQGTLTAM